MAPERGKVGVIHTGKYREKSVKDAGLGKGSPSWGLSFLICKIEGWYETGSGLYPIVQFRGEEGVGKSGCGKRRPGCSGTGSSWLSCISESVPRDGKFSTICIQHC